jgi:hypothetical protein
MRFLANENFPHHLGEIEFLDKFTVVERDRIRQRKIGGFYE